MPPLAALWARIEELGSTTQRQHQVLKGPKDAQARRDADAIEISCSSEKVDRAQQDFTNLEKQLSEAQRELNAILDPMERLPLEISSDIFDAPLIFLNICHSWSDIALSTPLLWTNIVIWHPHPPKLDKLLEVWLDRGRGLPLSLSFAGPFGGPDGSIEHRIRALVKQHAPRVRHLEVALNTRADLEELITMPFSALKRVSIASGMTSFPWAAECLALFRGAPELEEYTSDGLVYEDSANGPPLLTHPSLRHLHLGLPRWELDQVEGIQYGSTWSSAKILEFLTLPALETLLISDFDISHDILLAFLTRSSPRLRSLDLDIPPQGWSAAMVDRYCRLVPSLADLALETSAHDEDSQSLLLFLDTLATSPDLLPNRHLTIWGDFRHRPSPCKNFIRSLLSRGAPRPTQLQSFRLILMLFDEEDPDDDAMAEIAIALRPLANRTRIQDGWRIEATII
ncbi:hypothetical protein DFH09DRAFT_1282291 [Mycena vulgaris]|nr:hypothetical protein DFH09DRAFT_1282291 [Mycena vulgaris]